MHRKPLFDTVRHLLGRGFRQHEVAALDAAIDLLIESEPAISLPEPLARPRKASEGAVTLIKQFEGCARRRSDGQIEAYPDPGTGGQPWTIGWGATGADIGQDTVWSQSECDARLSQDIARYAAEVDQAISHAPTSQNQFDALVSFHYNTGAIHRATLTRKHCAGDYAGAAAEFGRWSKAGGQVLRGLVRRREAEAELYAQ
ncbi:glycoside hydrolase [Croceicoccus estronivorus]|uniref:lysozyme n=1 Tax=Croceicoccus estronivorus TaxID=1172626 RepID=UPI00082E8F24|nr:lysozyme [Croceicoccus estronivorus]OCC25220.1 glycoside hydrolase [Croceicoccus estronivorus]